jgi:hypothetical protein
VVTLRAPAGEERALLTTLVRGVPGVIEVAFADPDQPSGA